MNHILVIDLGGTNARFAVFDIFSRKKLKFCKDLCLKTNEASSFADLCRQAEASDWDFSIENFDAVTAAVPGPIISDDKLVKMAHIKWSIDIAGFKREHPLCNFFFINDFVAQAFGCLTEAVENAQLIKNGESASRQIVAIMGAGTGLGHGVLKSDGKGNYASLQSEAGHGNFSFTSKDEFDYSRFLLEKTENSYICSDLVVSGQGLSLLHEFLTGKQLEPSQVAAEITQESATAQWFSRFYARSARNYCLTVMPKAGTLYLTGGLAIKNHFLVDNDIFRDEFAGGSTTQGLTNDIAVYLNLNEKCGLWGAALLGALRLENIC